MFVVEGGSLQPPPSLLGCLGNTDHDDDDMGDDGDGDHDYSDHHMY